MSGRQDIPHTNRLALESSPYLQQHAHNPVDWYPWGEEAFAKAKAENKLVLISVGYSSCHWCHVMERECFEDAELALLMNERYVCVKVDREERPDVDHVYMAAVQLITGRGGWPLNCFALPDGSPVYGGTYFPPAQWARVLTDLHTTWTTDPTRVQQHAGQLRAGIRAEQVVQAPDERTSFGREELDHAVRTWEQRLDQTHGGSDKVPKFPLPNSYEFLLRYAHLSGNGSLLQHVELTLDRMALGGIFDQVGGGFARYSTDALWKVPHFEKMLYDNAQLISLYSQAYQAFKDPLHKATVERTIAFIEREMTASDGAFHSAIDADSDGEEGLYYVWDREELNAVLGEDLELTVAYFDIGGQALWEHGRNILRRGIPDAEFAKAYGIEAAMLEQRLQQIRAKLLDARMRRTPPSVDDKALTAWNAMMVKALCDASEVFDNPAWLTSAQRSMERILERCRRSDGGLWRVWHQGQARINGYLDDYASCIDALLALYSNTFDERWINEARAFAEHAMRHFLDTRTGLFHYTSDRDPPLITRPMELEDNVIPASNSVMARGLFQLGLLFDDNRYKELSTRMLTTMLPHAFQHPSAYANWLQILLAHLFPMNEIAITGPAALELRRAFAPYFIPNRSFLGHTSASTLPLLKDKSLPNSAIFVCVERTCRLPVTTVVEALRELQ